MNIITNSPPETNKKAITELGNTTDISSNDFMRKRYKLLDALQGFSTDKRVCSCHKRIINFKQKTEVYSDGSLNGLLLCNRVWVCPVCATRITLQRREELLSANLENYHLGLLTLTISHKKEDKLEDLLSDLTEMRKKLFSGRFWKDHRSNYDFEGMITTLEVTYGSNGWHTHIHCLMVYEKEIDYEEMNKLFSEKWGYLAGKQGVYVNDHGCDFKECSKLDYITKWTMQSEITLNNRKEGREGNITVWEMLERISEGETEYIPLWKEYEKAFFRKKQLVYSRGLKKKLGIEKAEKEVEEKELIYEIPKPDWKLVCKFGKIAEVRITAKNEGVSGIEKLLFELREKEKNRVIEKIKPKPKPILQGSLRDRLNSVFT